MLVGVATHWAGAAERRAPERRKRCGLAAVVHRGVGGIGMQEDARRDIMACPLLEFVFSLYVHVDKTSTNLLD
jgi:hypothetical protein